MARLALVWATLVVILQPFAVISAQEPPKPPEQELDLATIEDLLNLSIVAASRYEQRLSEAPATVVVVTEDQIRLRNYRSLLDLLADLPDFKVDYRVDPEWYHNVTVRGVRGQDKLVILLDGVRISAPTDETLPILENYPIHLAQRVEVVYGPASALYGADALSGVVNIITRRPARKGEATVALGDDERQFANFVAGIPLTAGCELSLAGQWYRDEQPNLAGDYDDYRGFQAQRDNDFPTIFGPQTATDPYDPDPSQPARANALYASLSSPEFTFTLFKNETKLSSSSAYTPDNAIYNDDTFIGHNLLVLGGRHRKTLGDFELETNLSGSRYGLDRDSNFRNAFTGMRRGYKYAESDALRAEHQTTWARSKRLMLAGGLSYESDHAIPWSTDLSEPVSNRDAVSGTILGTDIPADFFPLRYSNAGFFLQAQATVTDNITATIGARYDDNSRYGGSFNPRLGVVSNLGKLGTLKLLYGSAFLAPSPYAAYAHFGSFFSTDGGETYQSFFWRLPNPNLEPIESKTFEVNYQVSPRPSMALSANVYYTHLTNLYALVNDAETTHLYDGTYKGWPVAFIEVRSNLGKQSIYGGTLRYDYLRSFTIDRYVSAYAAYSYVDGEVDPLETGDELEIGGVTPSILRLGAELVSGRWSFSTRASLVGTQRLDSLRSGTDRRNTLDGYELVNVAVRYKLNDRIELTGTVANALDQQYRNGSEHAGATDLEFYGSPQDGLRGTIGVTARLP